MNHLRPRDDRHKCHDRGDPGDLGQCNCDYSREYPEQLPALSRGEKGAYFANTLKHSAGRNFMKAAHEQIAVGNHVGYRGLVWYTA
jgi:hypothetical protein